MPPPRYRSRTSGRGRAFLHGFDKGRAPRPRIVPPTGLLRAVAKELRLHPRLQPRRGDPSFARSLRVETIPMFHSRCVPCFRRKEAMAASEAENQDATVRGIF